jgi:hypothetical protein
MNDVPTGRRPRQKEDRATTWPPGEEYWYPWTDSNRRTWLRRPVLYPLSYRGTTLDQIVSAIPAGRESLTR